MPDSPNLACPGIAGYSITFRVWTAREHGITALTTEASAREDAERWVREKCREASRNIDRDLDDYADSIVCEPPCVKRVSKRELPSQPRTTFRDITDDKVECTGRFDAEIEVICEPPVELGATEELEPRPG